MAKNHTKPEHYEGKQFSPWEVIEEYFPTKWHVGTAFKYMSRMGKKIYPDCTAKESELHDTCKAIEELQRHKELLADELVAERKGNSPEEYLYFVDDSGNVYKRADESTWKLVTYTNANFNYNHVPWKKWA